MDNRPELNLAAYEYTLPEELIAQFPLERRDQSKLFVLDRAAGTFTHRSFADIIDYFRPGDCLVINRTRVVPVRLYAKKETGGKVEILFLDPCGKKDGRCAVLLKPFLPAGKKILLPGGGEAVVQEKTAQGETIVTVTGADVDALLERHGVMPLPPYIKRKDRTAIDTATFDRERYQTVFAREKGSIAAPTAGLHFTEELLAKVRQKGVSVAEIMLHVGWGTFRPITASTLDAHRMLPEYFAIDAPAAETIERTRKAGGRVIAVGTTSVRTLESAAARLGIDRGSGELRPVTGDTSLFIYPGYAFKLVDAMVTNFHLPHSTPLVLVSALADRETILRAYEEAVRQKYRFYSYGDAMLIL